LSVLGQPEDRAGEICAAKTGEGAALFGYPLPSDRFRLFNEHDTSRPVGTLPATSVLALQPKDPSRVPAVDKLAQLGREADGVINAVVEADKLVYSELVIPKHEHV